MILKLKTVYASPIRCIGSHELAEFSKEEGENLLKEKYAVVPTKEEIEKWRAKLAKARERSRDRDE